MAKAWWATAARFLEAYKKNIEHYRVAAVQLESLISEILVNTNAEVHQISARHKDLDSLREKLRDKKYSRPNRQLTDKVGVRVITYYQQDVAVIAKRLKEALQINARQSEDKRVHLKDPEFGYTSVHMIARLKGGWASSPEYFELRGMWFEIQIRSILEHAWAEIEHEVVYKSGISFPKTVKRRFARLAGAIELLEDEFLNLKREQWTLIEQHKKSYLSGLEASVEVDAARLIALLECERPGALGWRKAGEQGVPFRRHIENTCCRALKAVGLKSAASIRLLLKSKEFRRAEVRFANANRMLEPPSHLALSALAVAIKKPRVFSDYFPDLVNDPGIKLLLQPKKTKKRQHP
jgi:putative GTP pyrophosphokinase